MAVISVRLNAEEEKMVSFLSSEFDRDKSSLIKLSLKEMYDDFVDNKIIDLYEAKEKKNKSIFLSAEEILKQI